MLPLYGVRASKYSLKPWHTFSYFELHFVQRVIENGNYCQCLFLMGSLENNISEYSGYYEDT